ncbi:MAG: prepilin-type N-terminal cleavage/methylation domain-containing protein [Nitrospirae bacterium]|nr:prepilin-type N-terminal cleavage/methylation domain-containing protein [Nitrospirota bacterium]
MQIIVLLNKKGFRKIDIDNQTSNLICHCEHPKGAWQSRFKNARLLRFTRNDNFLCPFSGGFTLVEVLIALVVTLVVFLALMQTALVGIDSNMINILRDEAVSIADERMSAHRNVSFDDILLTDTNGAPNNPGNFVADTTIQRDVRNINNFPFTSMKRIDDLNDDNKLVEIQITWEWKEKTVANGDPYTHTISTIVRR